MKSTTKEPPRQIGEPFVEPKPAPQPAAVDVDEFHRDELRKWDERPRPKGSQRR